MCVFLWWHLQGSNQGHKDFQSFALPTELRCRFESAKIQKKMIFVLFLQKYFVHSYAHIVDKLVDN